MGISSVQLGIILVIVALLFGTKRLRSFGGDLGSAIKGFKNAVAEEPQNRLATESPDEPLTQHLEGAVTPKPESVGDS